NIFENVFSFFCTSTFVLIFFRSSFLRSQTVQINTTFSTTESASSDSRHQSPPVALNLKESSDRTPISPGKSCRTDSQITPTSTRPPTPNTTQKSNPSTPTHRTSIDHGHDRIRPQPSSSPIHHSRMASMDLRDLIPPFLMFDLDLDLDQDHFHHL
ncbi:hypothetical protein DFH28DRAFT_962047, partial [Melampsora americana]